MPADTAAAQANRATIERLYAALNDRDGEAMAACYAPGARFEDPAFGVLTDGEPGTMWRMLTSRAKDMRVDLVEHDAGDANGTAHWIAHYAFGGTGRKVTNDVRATFAFADGLITDHPDEFSLRRWAGQALGPVAGVLGYTPLLRVAIRRGTRKQLDAYAAQHPVAAR